MSTRSKDTSKDPAAERGTDTRSFEQPHGQPDPKTKPHRPYEKMPHERDESARSTGNRLDEQVPPSERQISDARENIESGQVDTDRRGIPNDVPSGKR